MAFRRLTAPSEAPDPDQLTSALGAIGMRLASRFVPDANIEDTLLFASIEGMDRDDLRVLALLVTWFGVHHAWVNVDRLTKLIVAEGSPRVHALWSAMASWQANDRRYAKLAALHRGPRIDLLSSGTEFQIRRRGEDPRFARGCLRVPSNVLRDRPSDVLTPEALASQHAAYRYRVMMGPSYRADLWAAIEARPDLRASELARSAYSSFASAWQVKRDHAVVAAARRRLPR